MGVDVVLLQTLSRLPYEHGKLKITLSYNASRLYSFENKNTPIVLSSLIYKTPFTAVAIQ